MYDGGPAFPTERQIKEPGSGASWMDYRWPGMSLLDVFAKEAMHGLLAGRWPVCDSDSDIAKASYRIARAMLAERMRLDTDGET